MDVGISFANIGQLGGPEGAAALGEACDAHGIESVWTVEHVVVPAGYESDVPVPQQRPDARRRGLTHPGPADLADLGRRPLRTSCCSAPGS